MCVHIFCPPVHMRGTMGWPLPSTWLDLHSLQLYPLPFWSLRFETCKGLYVEPPRWICSPPEEISPSWGYPSQRTLILLVGGVPNSVREPQNWMSSSSSPLNSKLVSEGCALVWEVPEGLLPMSASLPHNLWHSWFGWVIQVMELLNVILMCWDINVGLENESSCNWQVCF